MRSYRWWRFNIIVLCYSYVRTLQVSPLLSVTQTCPSLMLAAPHIFWHSIVVITVTDTACRGLKEPENSKFSKIDIRRQFPAIAVISITFVWNLYQHYKTNIVCYHWHNHGGCLHRSMTLILVGTNRGICAKLLWICWREGKQYDGNRLSQSAKNSLMPFWSSSFSYLKMSMFRNPSYAADWSKQFETVGKYFAYEEHVRRPQISI